MNFQKQRHHGKHVELYLVYLSSVVSLSTNVIIVPGRWTQLPLFVDGCLRAKRARNGRTQFSFLLLETMLPIISCFPGNFRHDGGNSPILDLLFDALVRRCRSFCSGTVSEIRTRIP